MIAIDGRTRARTPLAPVGTLLREWRAARRLSRFELALEADVSARHPSYAETGTGPRATW